MSHVLKDFVALRRFTAKYHHQKAKPARASVPLDNHLAMLIITHYHDMEVSWQLLSTRHGFKKFLTGELETSCASSPINLAQDDPWHFLRNQSRDCCSELSHKCV